MLTVVVCGHAGCFGQFANMGELYMWMNMQNMQSQQMINQALSEGTQMFTNQMAEIEKMELDRLKSLEMDESKSFAFKDRKSGDYGAVLFFSGNVGTNNYGLSTPVKVMSMFFDGDEKKYADITSKCTYWGNMILVPPVFEETSGVIVWSKKLAEEILHGSLVIIADDGEDKVENYGRYLQMVQVYNEGHTRMLQSMTGGGGYNSNLNGNTYSVPAQTAPAAKKCTRCNGTGEVAVSGVSYGNGNKWCSKCGETVPGGHYHNNCPVCGGKGYR
jgi:hypothetical protein